MFETVLGEARIGAKLRRRKSRCILLRPGPPFATKKREFNGEPLWGGKGCRGASAKEKMCPFWKDCVDLFLIGQMKQDVYNLYDEGKKNGHIDNSVFRGGRREVPRVLRFGSRMRRIHEKFEGT